MERRQRQAIGRNMSITANDLRERFNGLFGTVYTENKYIELSEDVTNLRALVGDIVIWIEEQESGYVERREALDSKLVEAVLEKRKDQPHPDLDFTYGAHNSCETIITHILRNFHLLNGRSCATCCGVCIECLLIAAENDLISRKEKKNVI
jgi:hypothetical protein